MMLSVFLLISQYESNCVVAMSMFGALESCMHNFTCNLHACICICVWAVAPESWKIAVLVHIPKQAHPSAMSHSRGLSLIDTFSKWYMQSFGDMG